jgi:hypothetical protein
MPATHFRSTPSPVAWRDGVVRNVTHNCLCMRSKGALKSIERLEAQMSHSDIGRRGTGRTASQAFLHGDALAGGNADTPRLPT